MAVRVKVVSNIPAFKGKLNAGIQKSLSDAALEIMKDAKSTWPPGAPVDTGVLRNSIGFTVGPNQLTIHAKAKYASHVEFGTRHMPARPFLRLSIEENKDKILNIFRRNLASSTG